jgi:anti-sigma regulatory factor (Ser/Thr protein kinase)
MADQITLTLPVDEDFQGIAYLVLGGLAARIDLTVEHLEDVEIALESLLERRGDTAVTIAVVIDRGKLQTSVGPFDGAVLADLEDDQAAALGLRRILETVCDTVEVEDRNGATWVQLTKATA